MSQVSYGTITVSDITDRGISGVTEYYAINNSSASAPATTAFQSSIISPTSNNPYLWNYEVISYTDNSTLSTVPHIAAVYGATGATGRGIQSITDYYAINNSGTTAPGWTAFGTNVVAPTSTSRFLWNYEKTIYTSGTPASASSDRRVIGVYGEQGDIGVGYVSEARLFYLKNSNISAPAKPTSAITSTSTAANVWTTKEPAWQSGYYYWTCHQFEKTDGTYTWTDVILDSALSSANETAAAAQAAAANATTIANSKAKITYGTAAPTVSGTEQAGDIYVQKSTSGTGGDVTWLWNSKTGAWVQNLTGSTTIVPGSIATAQLAANAVKADNIDASAVTTDKLDAGAVTAEKLDVVDINASGALTIGAMDDETQQAVSNCASFSDKGNIVVMENLTGGIPYKDVSVNIEPVQSGSGDTITGWTGATVTRTGKNLITQSYPQTFPISLNGVTWTHKSGVYGVSGTPTANSYFVISRMPLKPGTYTCGLVGESSNIMIQVWALDESVTRIGSVFNTITSGTFNTKDYPNAAYYEFLFGRRTNGLECSGTFQIQLERGSEVTDYEPYQGDTYTVDWTSEAGTIYGGTLDVTTGVLTSTLDANGDALANPVTYQLTTTEVTTLLGTNILWADTGDIGVEYANDISGFATHSQLATNGQTIINGGNITTGSIDAARITTGKLNANYIKLGGKMDVFKTATSTDVGGNLGYISDISYYVNQNSISESFVFESGTINSSGNDTTGNYCYRSNNYLPIPDNGILIITFVSPITSVLINEYKETTSSSGTTMPHIKQTTLNAPNTITLDSNTTHIRCAVVYNSQRRISSSSVSRLVNITPSSSTTTTSTGIGLLNDQSDNDSPLLRLIQSSNEEAGLYEFIEKYNGYWFNKYSATLQNGMFSLSPNTKFGLPPGQLYGYLKDGTYIPWFTTFWTNATPSSGFESHDESNPIVTVPNLSLYDYIIVEICYNNKEPSSPSDWSGVHTRRCTIFKNTPVASQQSWTEHFMANLTWYDSGKILAVYRSFWVVDKTKICCNVGTWTSPSSTSDSKNYAIPTRIMGIMGGVKEV